jgi:hypothetical protein
MLDFVRRLFVRIAPNYTAWCGALTDFLGAQGYHLPGDDPLRRRFANALQWFMSLNDMTSTRIDNILHQVRADLVPSSAVAGNYRSPAAHCDNDTAVAKEKVPLNESETEETEDETEEETEQGESRKRNRENSSDKEEQDTSTPHSHNTPLVRPSEYLRKRCPLCFGGSW